MSEIEKQFFDTFGIEPITYCEHGCSGVNLSVKCKNCIYVDELIYPQITDHIMLELICIVLNTFEHFEVNRIMNISTLKEKILKLLILAEDDVYSQVQALFKENN